MGKRLEFKFIIFQNESKIVDMYKVNVETNNVLKHSPNKKCYS